MQTIAVVNEKGGTAKTTTTVNLSAALGEAGQRVLLVDLDGQAASSRWLGVENDNRLADALLSGQAMEPIENVAPGLSLAPATGKLDSVSHELRPTQGGRLRKILSLLDRRFDFALIDCPPSLANRLIGNALLAATHVIVPVETSILALDGLRILLTTLEDVRDGFGHELTLGGVLACRYDARTRLSNLVLAELIRALGDKVFRTVIRENVRMREGPASGQSILGFAPESHAAEDYRALAKEILSAPEIWKTSPGDQRQHRGVDMDSVGGLRNEAAAKVREFSQEPPKQYSLDHIRIESTSPSEGVTTPSPVEPPAAPKPAMPSPAPPSAAPAPAMPPSGPPAGHGSTLVPHELPPANAGVSFDSVPQAPESTPSPDGPPEARALEPAMPQAAQDPVDAAATADSSSQPSEADSRADGFQSLLDGLNQAEKRIESVESEEGAVPEEVPEISRVAPATPSSFAEGSSSSAPDVPTESMTPSASQDQTGDETLEYRVDPGPESQSQSEGSPDSPASSEQGSDTPQPDPAATGLGGISGEAKPNTGEHAWRSPEGVQAEETEGTASESSDAPPADGSETPKAEKAESEQEKPFELLEDPPSKSSEAESTDAEEDSDDQYPALQAFVEQMRREGKLPSSDEQDNKDGKQSAGLRGLFRKMVGS